MCSSKEHDLVEMEKQELFGFFKNQLLIISYMTEKWSLEPREVSNKKPEKKVSVKPNSNDKESSKKK